MSLFDKLPLEITEIIYKASLKEHIANLHSNVIEFHLKNARKRLTYRLVKFRKMSRLEDELRRLLKVVSNAIEKNTWHGIQNKLFYIDVACKLVGHNERLIKKNGGESLIAVASEKLRELMLDMDLV
jgi:hypothetical protein